MEKSNVIINELVKRIENKYTKVEILWNVWQREETVIGLRNDINVSMVVMKDILYCRKKIGLDLIKKYKISKKELYECVTIAFNIVYKLGITDYMGGAPWIFESANAYFDYSINKVKNQELHKLWEQQRNII